LFKLPPTSKLKKLEVTLASVLGTAVAAPGVWAVPVSTTEGAEVIGCPARAARLLSGSRGRVAWKRDLVGAAVSREKGPFASGSAMKSEANRWSDL
jgi:hypothetical protein